MKHRALFLDRDGTLVQPRHYPSRPEHLVLFHGIDNHLRVLQSAGFCLVVVTNQAGIARGLFTDHDLAHMHRHLTAEFANLGVQLDAIYHCPHHPDGVVPDLAMPCDCRKPAPGMVLRAAEDLDLDPHASWFVGDILDDVQAGRTAGCRTVLVDLGTESTPTTATRHPDYVARDTVHALEIIRSVEGLGPDVDLAYRPQSWRDLVEVGS